MNLQNSLGVDTPSGDSSFINDPVQFYVACGFLLIFISLIVMNLRGQWVARTPVQHRNWRVITTVLMAIIGTLFLDGVIKLEGNFEYITVYAVGGAAFGLVNFFFWGKFEKPEGIDKVPGVNIPLNEGDTLQKAIDLINQMASFKVQLEGFDASELNISIPYPQDIVIRSNSIRKDLSNLLNDFQGLRECKVQKKNESLYIIT